MAKGKVLIDFASARAGLREKHYLVNGVTIENFNGYRTLVLVSNDKHQNIIESKISPTQFRNLINEGFLRYNNL